VCVYELIKVRKIISEFLCGRKFRKGCFVFLQNKIVSFKIRKHTCLNAKFLIHWLSVTPVTCFGYTIRSSLGSYRLTRLTQHTLHIVIHKL